jgi:hypothetical protein
MLGGNGRLRGGELMGGIVQQLGKSIAVYLKALQLQTTPDTLDPLASQKVGSIVKRLLSLAQFIAQSGAVVALVASVNVDSLELACELFDTVLLPFDMALLPFIQTACLSEFSEKSGDLSCGDFGVVLLLLWIAGTGNVVICHIGRIRGTTHRGGHQLPPRDTPATRANECILEDMLGSLDHSTRRRVRDITYGRCAVCPGRRRAGQARPRV